MGEYFLENLLLFLYVYAIIFASKEKRADRLGYASAFDSADIRIRVNIRTHKNMRSFIRRIGYAATWRKDK